MTERNAGLRAGEVTNVRTVSGALAADSGTLTDTNIPPASGVSCKGLDTILLGFEQTGGVNTTVVVEALFRDPTAADGSRWKRILLGSRDGVNTIAAPAAMVTTALDGTAFIEVPVFGHSLVFFRVSAIANEGGVTAWKLLGLPGRQRQRGAMVGD